MPKDIPYTNKAEPIKQTKPKAKKLCEHFKNLKGQRRNFETYWQSLHDYFYLESPDINVEYYPGTELTSDFLFDSTTLEASDILASGFMNYLTPPTSRWFSLRAKNPALQLNKKVANFLEDVSDAVNAVLNNSNFYQTMFPAFKSSGVFGTSVLMEEEDVEEDVRFYNIPIKQVCLVEDAKGRVVAYYVEFEYTVSQAASRWGIESLSVPMKEEYSVNPVSNKKWPFILYIGKRHVRDIKKNNKENLPIEALWIDYKEEKVMAESGYNEFPSFCHRFDKRPFIPWGFSPAMKSLPFARILNAVAKTNLRSMMKHTDPAIAVPSNAFIMPLNGNPRAVNYYNKNKMEGNKDLITFGNTGNPQVGMTAVEYYSNQVKALMFNDVFMAFANLTKRMNNPEVMERINEKMTLLGPAVGRYISEVLNPIIIRTIGILERKGKLPEPPAEFLMNPVYEIDCISRLAQAQRKSELDALVGGLSLVGEMAQYSPDVLDKISMDRVVDETWSIVGASSKVLRGEDEVAEIREAKAQAAQQQMDLERLKDGAALAESGSKTDLNMAKAQGE